MMRANSSVPHLEIFHHELFGKIRTVLINGEPWFFGRDIAKALGYAKTQNAVSRHCKHAIRLTEEKLNDSRGPAMAPLESLDFSGSSEEIGNDSRGRLNMIPESLRFTVPPTLIPESDVYRMIANSKLKNAQKFADWLYEVVLPALRKYGSYSMLPTEAPTPTLTLTYEKAFPELQAAEEIAKFMGYEGNQAKLAAIKALKNGYGMDLVKVFPPMYLPSRKQSMRLTPTELGVKLDCSCQKANRILEAAGFQLATRGLPDGHHKLGRIQWGLTEEGKEYGELLDVGRRHGNGAPIQQIKWYESIVPVLQQKLNDGMKVVMRTQNKALLTLVGKKAGEEK